MTHAKAEQCEQQLKQLARSGDLKRITLSNSSSHCFVSDRGAQILKDDYGIEASAMGAQLQGVFKDYALGKATNYIPSEKLTEIVGKLGTSNALRGEWTFVWQNKAPSAGEGRA